MVTVYTKEDIDDRMTEISNHLSAIIGEINKIKVEIGLVEPHPATKGEEPEE